MSAAISVLVILFKIVEAILGRLDEDRRASAIKLALDALKVKADGEVISRAVRAFDAPVVGPDGVLGDKGDFRD